MKKQSLPADRAVGSKWLAAGAVVAAILGLLDPALAQTNPPMPPSGDGVVQADLKPAPVGAVEPGVLEVVNADHKAFLEPGADPSVDPNLQQAGCKGCANGVMIGGGALTGCSSCGANGCIPGRFRHCDSCDSSCCCCRIFCGLYECICCPDPCYEPQWIPAANAAFFVDTARPRTHMRFRWDSAFDFTFPDRAEYFWAKIGGRGPANPETIIDYDEFSHYVEAASGNFAAFIETPYRQTDPLVNDGHSGFSDLKAGTKSMLLDCELVQVTFQFKTYIPTGVASKGLGTGHLSLEPSMLFALRLASDLYLQAQTAYWIPIAGSDFAGDVFHYHLSLNQVLYRPLCDIDIIGTLELSGWSILDGAMTDPAGNPDKAKEHFMAGGPGLRVSICDKIDFGIGVSFAFEDDSNFGETVYRSEIRLLY